jgi:thioredoxin reductase (NADPH)
MGPFSGDNEIVVVGGGDSAVTEALFLSNSLRVDGDSPAGCPRATKFIRRGLGNPKIKFLWDSVVEEIKGDKVVQSVVVKM